MKRQNNDNTRAITDRRFRYGYAATDTTFPNADRAGREKVRKKRARNPRLKWVINAACGGIASRGSSTETVTYAGRPRRLVVTHTQLLGRVRRFTCQESHNFLIVATRTSNQNPFVSLSVCCCFGLPFCRVNPRGFGSAPTTRRGVPTRTTTTSKLTTNELIACNYFTPLCPSVFSCCVFCASDCTRRSCSPSPLPPVLLLLSVDILSSGVTAYQQLHVSCLSAVWPARTLKNLHIFLINRMENVARIFIWFPLPARTDKMLSPQLIIVACSHPLGFFFGRVRKDDIGL